MQTPDLCPGFTAQQMCVASVIQSIQVSVFSSIKWDNSRNYFRIVLQDDMVYITQEKCSAEWHILGAQETLSIAYVI